MCEEWFDWSTGTGGGKYSCRIPSCQLTSEMISWMRSNGYTDLTPEGACKVTNVPWPLYNTNAFRVAGVCQDVCNWCFDGLADVQSSGLAKGTLGTTI